MKIEIITRKPKGKARPTPLLFVHGICHAAWCWDEFFLPYFAEHGYESHALSLRGHGGSERNKPLSVLRIKDYVDDVAGIAASFNTRPALVGHSMGGFIVQKYLETHTAPAGVLLASVPPHGAILATLRSAWHDPISFVKVNLTWNLKPVVATPASTRWIFFSNNMPDEQLQRYHQRGQGESYWAYLDFLLLNLPRPRKVTTPILVLGGAEDTSFSPAEVEATARAYHAPFEIFPMAHAMMLEAGWQKVADRIIGWLEEKGL